jgi:putative spermidine/putrescine transport system permease protein
MTSAASALDAPATGPQGLARSLARAQRRRHFAAIALTLPLLVFLLVTLLVPIGALLVRAVENPEVAGTLPRTARALAGWDRRTEPPAAAFAAVADDLGQLSDGSEAGALARRLNTEVRARWSCRPTARCRSVKACLPNRCVLACSSSMAGGPS